MLFFHVFRPTLLWPAYTKCNPLSCIKVLSNMTSMNKNDHKTIFNHVYETCEWGNNNANSYKGLSGGGSTINFNEYIYIPFLRNFIESNKISTVCDLGCGDFLCGKLIYDNLNVQYNGYDVYGKLIDFHQNTYNGSDKYKFFHTDIFSERENIQSADLCILKDILQHWDLQSIYTFMDFLVDSKKFKYIIICNCCNQNEDNTDIITGSGRPLSSLFLPLRKYKPVNMFYYNTKEVSIIKLE